MCDVVVQHAGEARSKVRAAAANWQTAAGMAGRKPD
jgi:hypothetical protein